MLAHGYDISISLYYDIIISFRQNFAPFNMVKIKCGSGFLLHIY